MMAAGMMPNTLMNGIASAPADSDKKGVLRVSQNRVVERDKEEHQKDRNNFLGFHSINGPKKGSPDLLNSCFTSADISPHDSICSQRPCKDLVP